MNFAYLHLIINHIPIIGIPVALVFLIYGMRTQNRVIERFSLLVLFAIAAMVVPVYLTGEPAEEAVEHLPGFAESFIESHEDAAKFSLVLTLAAGALAFIALWLQNFELRRQQINLAVLGVATIALLSLGYTAYLGGKIRHSEFRTDSVTQETGVPSFERKGGDDD